MTVLRVWACSAAALLAIGTVVPVAQQRSPQQNRPPAEYAKALEESTRVARLRVPRVVAPLGLKSGMRVADIGAGPGLFTRPIATAIAPGVIYAVDNAELLTILTRLENRFFTIYR